MVADADIDPPFQLDKFISRSRQLDLSGIALEDAGRYPLSAGEVRVVRYMQDTEFFTVIYMKALLETRALADEEARAFLVVWGYEECSHGRALARFLEAAGHAPSRRSIQEFARPRGMLELAQDFGSRIASALSEDFLAVHMTWGAINELTAVQAYTRLADQTENPILAQILRRIVKDERRHFAFYLQQARRRLGPAFARRLVKFALTRLWAPVGVSMSEQADSDFVCAYLFGDAEGHAALRVVDTTIARLPGMAWFGLVEPAFRAGAARCVGAGTPMNRPVPAEPRPAATIA